MSKKIYNLIIIFTVIILTCLNSECDPQNLSQDIDTLNEKQYQLYIDTLNEKNANVDLTIKTFIEDTITNKLRGDDSSFKFSIEQFEQDLKDHSEFTDYNNLLENLNDFKRSDYLPIDNLKSYTIIFIDLCSLAHNIFNFISEGKYDKSKIEGHPLLSLHKFHRSRFISLFYRKLKDKYDKSPIPGLTAGYTKRLLTANTHMYLNGLKHGVLNKKFYNQEDSIRNLYDLSNRFRYGSIKDTLEKHSKKLDLLLKCENYNRTIIDVNCIKNFLKNKKKSQPFFNTKVYKFFKNKTIKPNF